jgi:AraC-like DNA-binding protein
MERKEMMPPVYLYRRIVQAKLFIDNNFQEALNLENIAGEAMFSKFHFIRLFKTIYGKTPHQYLISVRIDAARLLLEQNQPIKEVCFAVGFDSVSSFSILFKRLTTFSPSHYQQQCMERKKRMLQEPLSFIPNCFLEQHLAKPQFSIHQASLQS